ncbi:MAG TPA: hypothetical protein VLQ80_30675, partial [Candidatus Saccharimonadia bacterium]|nr:hypothetical protein [Candidatus Saccharimonadia bacterium]
MPWVMALLPVNFSCLTLGVRRCRKPQRGTSGATVLVVKGALYIFEFCTSWACHGVRGFSMALRMVK